MRVLRSFADGLAMRSRPILHIGLILCALLAALPAPSWAASFDCAKASTAVERLICGSPTLNRLDEELARLYALGQQSYASLPDSLAGYRSDQRKWLAQERNRCTTADCLGLTMWQRAAMFRTSLERAGPSPAAVAETAPTAIELGKLLATERASPAAPVAPKPEQTEAAAPSPRTALAAPRPAGLTPRNPKKLDLCETDDATPNHLALCDDPVHDGVLMSLWIKRNQAVTELRWEKASRRRALTPQVIAPLQRFMAQPESACPRMDKRCLDEAVVNLGVEMFDIATQLAYAGRVERDAISKVKSAQRDAEPVLVDNGGSASIDTQRHGGNYTMLKVRNRTPTGLRQIDVACHLYEDWDDDKPIDPAELRTSIRGNIAPQSGNFYSAPIATPWDLKRYGTDAQVVKCRVLGSVASSAAQAQDATSQRDVDAERLAAARAQLLQASDRRRAEVEADQVLRLRAALQAGYAAGTPTCRAMVSSWAGQLQTVRKYQDMNLKSQAVGLVDGMIGELRRSGCPVA